MVGGARRRKLALPDLGEVTRKSISLPGGLEALTKNDTGTFWKLQEQGMQKK